MTINYNKQIVHDQLEEVSGDLCVYLHDLKDEIVSWENRYPEYELSIERQYHSSDGYTYYLYGKRDETDEESANRIKREEKALEYEKQQNLDKEKRDKTRLKNLMDKYPDEVESNLKEK